MDKNSILSGCFSSDEKDFISKTIKRLGNAPMTDTAHGYQKEKNETILEAAKRSVKEYSQKSRISSAVAIMSVILAAGRNYEKTVRPYVAKLQKNHANLTLTGLNELIKNNNSAKSFKEIWGPNDPRKFQILKEILAVFLSKLNQKDTADNDFRVISDWAKNTSLLNKDDPIHSIKYVGIATFQHLRMTFGVDTVKPDQRVKEVLEREFGLTLTDKQSIVALEQIAKLENTTNLFIDQIFVKYGSGHYASKRLSTQCKVIG